MSYIYEDQLPDDITAEEYDEWYKHSYVVDDCVRVGPPVPLKGESDV